MANCSLGNETLTAEECQLREHQEVYWLLATIATGISFLALAHLFYIYIRDPVFRKAPLVFFHLMLLGDLIFTLTYLPYHSRNLVILFLEGYVDLETSVVFCNVTWYTAATSLALEFCGYVLIAYYPYKMLHSKLRFREKVEGQRLRKLAFLIGFGSANIWVIVGYGMKHVGSYRGLYCGVKAWDNIQGFFLFSYAFLAFSFMSYFYYQSYKVLNEKIESSKISSSKVKTASRKIIKLGIQLLAGFLITWGPLTVSCFLNFVGLKHLVPIQFDMLAGNLTKWKPLLDYFLVMSLLKEQKRKGSDNNSSAGHTQFVRTNKVAASEAQ